MKIIGLCGKARAGKDTVAALIAQETRRHVIRQGFADALKISAALALGFDGAPEECIGFCDSLKVCGGISTTVEHGPYDIQEVYVNGRQYLQRYGTEAHRDIFGKDFWLDAVLPQGRDDCDILVIPDVRFENEAQRIWDRGGELWRVVRPGQDEVGAGHSSEAGIPDALVDRIVRNTSTVEDLSPLVRGYLQ